MPRKSAHHPPYFMPVRKYGNGTLEKLFGIYNRTIEVMAVLAMAVLLVHWLLLLWFVLSRIGQLNFLRLHYTAALGVDWIDVWWKIFIFPGFGLVVFFVNGLIAGALSKSHRMFGSVLYGITIFLQLLFLIGGVMAALLNG